MARILGVDSLDLNIVMHPLTRGHIVRMHRATKNVHSLEEHMDQLKKIRDAAFDDDNYKIALQAETQLGKAAGHYDPKPVDPLTDPNNQNVDPTKLSTEDLRRRIAGAIGAVVPVGGDQRALSGGDQADVMADRDFDDDDEPRRKDNMI
jgi:hypothetical protein